MTGVICVAAVAYTLFAGSPIVQGQWVNSGSRHAI